MSQRKYYIARLSQLSQARAVLPTITHVLKSLPFHHGGAAYTQRGTFDNTIASQQGTGADGASHGESSEEEDEEDGGSSSSSSTVRPQSRLSHPGEDDSDWEEMALLDDLHYDSGWDIPVVMPKVCENSVKFQRGCSSFILQFPVAYYELDTSDIDPSEGVEMFTGACSGSGDGRTCKAYITRVLLPHFGKKEYEDPHYTRKRKDIQIQAILDSIVIFLSILFSRPGPGRPSPSIDFRGDIDIENLEELPLITRQPSVRLRKRAATL
ncbi:hypothetical protein CPC08DRAFT_456826 [Agrocybe pediades]|nr:hypothetical protein CPC08DRAFT_456826 [Agrocybe pediades]